MQAVLTDEIVDRAWELRDHGFSWKRIMRELHYPVKTISAFRNYRMRKGWDIIDPTPQPLGVPPYAARNGETPRERAFRRFPICYRPEFN